MQIVLKQFTNDFRNLPTCQMINREIFTPSPKSIFLGSVTQIRLHMYNRHVHVVLEQMFTNKGFIDNNQMWQPSHTTDSPQTFRGTFFFMEYT